MSHPTSASPSRIPPLSTRTRRCAVAAAGVAVLALTAAALPGASATPASRPAETMGPLGVPSAPVFRTPTTDDSTPMYGIGAVHGDDVWSVGYSVDPTTYVHTALVEHSTGRSWTTSPVQGPKGSTMSQLFGVGVLSRKSAWAVGNAQLSTGVTLAEHWNGKKWSVVKTPAITGAMFADLWHVSAISANNVWAAGASSADGSVWNTLIEHWNGHKWSIVSSPNGPGATGSVLQGISAVSADDIWVSGYAYVTGGAYTGLVEHWDGASWTVVDSPQPSQDVMLADVVATSATDATAVGQMIATDQESILTLTEHWDGSSWTVESSPNPEGAVVSSLTGVSASSPTDVWAVGSAATASATTTLTEHWDGSAWTIVKSKDASGGSSNVLAGVTSLSSGRAWAIGEAVALSGVTSLLAEKWNGKHWKLIS